MIKEMKRVIAIFMALVIAFALCGCSNHPQRGDTSPVSNDFVILDYEYFGGDNGYRNYTVYHKGTGVVYLIIESSYRLAITPLYNADGSVMTLDDWRGDNVIS